MQKKIIVTLITLSLISLPAAATQKKALNPFATPSTLPLEAPPFNVIKDTDYLPALVEGMKQQLHEIDMIATNPAAPTFDNTIAAMEKSGRMLNRTSDTFFAVVQANTNPVLDRTQQIIAPKLAAERDAIFLNAKLFSRIQTLYLQRDDLALNQEQKQLLSIYYHDFIHSGANLSPKDKTKLKKLNKQLAELETSFQQKLLAGTKANELIINNKADLAGLSNSEIAALEVTRHGKKQYVIPLQNTTQQPLLESLTKREVREQLFKHSWSRTENQPSTDTRDIISRMAKLRAEKAALLGYPNYASYVLYDQMAENPQTVHQFMNQLIPATAAKAKADAHDIQTTINKTQHFELKPWDWNYYAEQIRKEKYDLDQNAIKPYFELNQVLVNGVFFAANQLYGITFRERHDIPVYHPDVRVFDVFDHDHTQLGMIYLDYFKRDNKTGGAWMSHFVEQSTLLNTKPVIYNVTNFTKPAPGQPALLTSDDVRTMFHEFGHALHGLFAKNTYPLSNSNIARDFVELPSQFNEHWATYPTVFKNYAKHYQTGQPMPTALADKMAKASQFNQAYSLGERLAASALDMEWHELTANAPRQQVDAFETQALNATHTNFTNVPTRYRSSYFLHIWANGYPAGYYAYLWTQMLDEDIYDWFIQHGGLTRENGQRYRDLILSRGHTDSYHHMFESFYGKKPTIAPMLKSLGLT